MHTGHRYTLFQTLRWSRRNLVLPMLWATVVTVLYEIIGWELRIPLLPLTTISGAVAFYLGFKNNASYDRMWEARKIWGAIVNASRSWAYGSRDLISRVHGGSTMDTELARIRNRLVLRHVAWMDALRHQLRQVKSWEHSGEIYTRMRSSVAEYQEDLESVLGENISNVETKEVLAQINPAARLLANQSRDLAELRSRQLLDGFSHIHLQGLLDELMTQQGKAERIKNFPFPRQYSTVNSYFALLLVILTPFGMLSPFEEIGTVWLNVPFSGIVAWVFLTTDQIGGWSENPFEGLTNDVPITTMARGIERDVRQIAGISDLPPPREQVGAIQY